ncbi:hypothetical protein [Hungatella hathewayi]|uniref:hypothetical protein n=1 Tax=Hungatella hathewayi TaxID=154046 RepID=UPI0035692088
MLIDIEKIEEVMKNRTINDMYFKLFNEKFNNLSSRDLSAIKSMFGEVNELVWKTASWNSSRLSEYHSQLEYSIKTMYLAITNMLGYDFQATYLTQKFAVCVAFYAFIQSK